MQHKRPPKVAPLLTPFQGSSTIVPQICFIHQKSTKDDAENLTFYATEEVPLGKINGLKLKNNRYEILS